VIIVNYNVREFLDHALTSVRKAMTGIRGEVIVVDNASDDGSVEMLRKRYPEVQRIANASNLGFAKANNLALRRARGDYLLLLNPDTIVQEDTFRVMITFFEQHPEVGLAGCKILNPDGSFQLACRRSFPTPWVAFTKLFGLSALFPTSKLFGRYNLTYLDPNETCEVDAVSGSFMMVRREVYERVGGLDEDFFMYGEDLDWCYRIQQAGWKIYYVPTTQIIHYKGESTKRSSIDEIKTFYEAMELFVSKHLSTSFVLSGLIRLGIVLSSVIARVGQFLRPLRVAVLDLLFVDLALVAAEGIWRGELFSFPAHSYPVVYTIPALIVVGSLGVAGVYTHRRMSVSRTMGAVVVSYVVIAAFVAFFKEYAFSRAVILLSGTLSFLLVPGWRLVARLAGKSSGAGRRSLFGRRTLIVGTDRAAQEILRRIRNRVADGYEVVGFIDTTRRRIGEQVAGLPILGSGDHIGKVIADRRITDVIFSTQTLSYTDILSVISRAGNRAVNFHIVPNTLEVIIGKASVDSLDDLPLVPISYNIEKPFNRAVKRLFDLCLSFLLLLSVYPFVYLKHTLGTSRSRLILSLPSVVSGKYSLVGPPSESVPPARGKTSSERGSHSLFWGKPGLTGLVQLQAGRALTDEEVEQYNLYYARNQSILLDVEILLKTLFSSTRGGTALSVPLTEDRDRTAIRSRTQSKGVS
jgi:GT2 family glycosyltransferase/lipopolysaccharide/colanic/teichoic acid biosynthesis glycosyltransferase